MTVSGIEEISHDELNEAKSGILMVCAGSGSRFLQFAGNMNKEDCESCNLLADKQQPPRLLKTHPMDKRLSMLQKTGMIDGLPPRRNISKNQGLMQNMSKTMSTTTCIRCKEASRDYTKRSLELSKTVRVSVYSNGSSPYFVIYDSTAKFATPVLHQKLRRCQIVPFSTADTSTESDDEIGDRRFRIFPNMSDDVIILQTSNKTQRDDWVNFLAPLTQAEVSSFAPHKTHHHLMKSSLSMLEEAEEPNEELQSESLKAPTRRQKSKVRRSSLTGVGVRLLRRPLPRPLA